MTCRLASITKLLRRHGQRRCTWPERFRLTLYDAAYLELAQRLALPLATLDEELRAAARDLGVPSLGAGQRSCRRLRVSISARADSALDHECCVNVPRALPCSAHSLWALLFKVASRSHGAIAVFE